MKRSPVKLAIYVFLLSIFPIALFANSFPPPKDFKGLRSYILSQAAATDIDYAFALTDSLKAMASNPKEALRADMVDAVLHYQIGDKLVALDIAMEVEKQLKKKNIYTDQITVIGFIASNFKEIGLNEEARYYLYKATKSIESVQDPHLKAQYGTLMNHELASINIDLGDYETAKSNIKVAYDYVEGIQTEDLLAFFLATTMQIDAVIEYHLENYLLSKQLLNRALETLNTKEDLLYGAIHLSFAKIALKEENFDAVAFHLQEVEEMVGQSRYFALKRALYQEYIAYYYALEDPIEVGIYKAKLNELKVQNQKDAVAISDAALVKLRAKVSKGETITKVLLAVGFVLLVLSLSWTILFFKKRKFYAEQGENKSNKAAKPSNAKMSPISDNTERRILEALNDLEREYFFLNPNVTLSRIASELETNTKYLSSIILKHRKKNFSAYINYMRIQYILHKLHKDEVYRKYKISYLAEIAGFSSHSKFSSEFKNTLGKSPSAYIEHLVEKEKVIEQEMNS